MTTLDSASTRELSSLRSVTGRLPLLGNLLQLEPRRLHLQLEKWAEELGAAYTFVLGSHRVLILSDLELIQQILRGRPQGFRRMGAMREVLNELGIVGVFTAEGEDWARQRKLVMAAFTPASLRASYESIALCTRRLHGQWSAAAARGDSVDVLRDLMRYTVDVTSMLAFGEDLNTLETGAGFLQRNLATLFAAVNRRLQAPFPYWRYFSLPADHALQRSLAEVERSILDIVQRARAQRELTPEREPRNLLEAMLAARDGDHPNAQLSDRELYGNVFTLLLAGEDTTANTLAWMIYFMAQHRDVQRRMSSESETLPDPLGVPASHESAQGLRYIAAVVQETLRLKSPAPLLFMEPNEDTVLGDLRVPAGTPLWLLTRLLAVRPESFHAPLAFDPTRWLGSPDGKHEARTSLAFGIGPRVCPGRALALLESAAVGAMVARSFDVSLVDGAQPVGEAMNFTMQPANLRIRFSPRKKS